MWNARPKHWCLPEFRGRTHRASPSTLFFPIVSLAREKIGPPEARQKRPRRNESLQARLLILCARFFLSKPQTEFAVWVFLCKSAATSQSRLRRASIPTPFVPLSQPAADSSPGRGAKGMRTAGGSHNLSVSCADSIPTPFVPSGHFPLIGGIGPWKGSLSTTYQTARRNPFENCLF